MAYIRRGKKENFDYPGTNYVKVGNFAYIVDHSRGSEVDDNLRSGGDGFGMRDKVNMTNATEKDYEILNKVRTRGEYLSERSLNAVLMQLRANRRRNSNNKSLFGDGNTANRDGIENATTNLYETKVRGFVEDGRESEGNVSSGGVENSRFRRRKPAQAATFFSGGGLIETALRGIIKPRLAAEYKKTVKNVYKDNHGNHMVLGYIHGIDIIVMD